MKRDANIELYRCLLMFGIVLLHTVGQSLGEDIWFSSGLMFCVNGFLLISGYFGIKFSWDRIGKLYAIGYWSSLVGAFAMMSVGEGAFISAWHSVYDSWFLHAYILLMMVSPILNGYMERFKGGVVSRQLLELLPLFVLCFIWSWPTSYNCTIGIVPRTAGLGHFSGLMMVGMYIAGRLVRFYDIERRLPLKYVIPTMMILFVPAFLKLGFYNSPIALALSICSFVLVRRIKVKGWLSRVVLFVSPSMFAVYMLHVTPYGMQRIIPEGVDLALGFGFGKWSAYILVACFVFVSCILFDLIRRGFLELFRKMVRYET